MFGWIDVSEGRLAGSIYLYLNIYIYRERERESEIHRYSFI